MPHLGQMFRVPSCCAAQAVTGALGEMDLTSAQGHVMGYLARCQAPPCPRDVEEHFHLSHPTVSGLLARLEKKEFIELRPDPADKRCKRIYTLPKGRDCHEKIYKAILENEECIVRGFSQEEQDQFADFLTRATRNMGVEPCQTIKEESNP